MIDASHTHVLLAALKRRGFESFDDARSRVVAERYPSDVARWETWYLDMLASAILALEANDHRVALRSFFLACEYRGRLGGVSPDATGDVHGAIAAELVDRLAPFTR